MMEKTAVVIPAAGQGKRMQQRKSKQYIEVMGKSILSMTLDIFEESTLIDDIILVVGSGEVSVVEAALKEMRGYKKIRAIIEGGGERQESVYKGLLMLDESVRWVMIHDAVRPLFDGAHIEAVLSNTRRFKACAVGVKVKDTIKIVDEEQFIVDTPDRSMLYAIQTPQSFEKKLIIEAHQRAKEANFLGTDDAMLVERFCQVPVKVIEGSYENIKVTTPEDLITLKAIIERKCQNR